MIKRIVYFCLCFVFITSCLSYAQSSSTELEKFQEHNPDIQKYDFIQSYLTGLSYFYRNDKNESLITADFQSQESTREVMDMLLKNNVNFRIARNLVTSFQSSNNQFVAKASDMFILLCDEQISINKQELELLKVLYDAYAFDKIEEFDRENFISQQQKLSSVRKISLEDLIKTSVLATKILVSAKTDYYGELNTLALTKIQKDSLINRLEWEFQGEEFQGTPREGQTYLQVSISTIRSFLEDYDWDTL